MLVARKFKPKGLEGKDHFAIYADHTFILWKKIECKDTPIEASKEKPLFGASVGLSIDKDIEEREAEQTKQKYHRMMGEFRQQPFFTSGILCKQRNIAKKWEYRIEGGALILKDAQYFPSITSMTHYCYEHGLIDMERINKQERERIEMELSLPEIFEDDFSKAKIIEKFD